MSTKPLISAMSLCMTTFAATVCSQDFPSKPIRMMASGPASTSDIVARALASVMSERLGQPMITDNAVARGAMLTATAQPDGHTLLIDGRSLWQGPLFQDVPYDAVKDFAPISRATSSIYLLTVHPSLPVSSVKELIAYAKARPGALNFGSGEVGSGGHLGTELFNYMAGIRMVHVPYKGAQMFGALVAGEVQVAFVGGTEPLPLMKAGKLKVLGVASKTPSPRAPGVPTIAESGVPDYELTQILAVFTTGKTPAPRINLLSQEIRRALEMPEVQKRIATIGLEAQGSTPQELEALIKEDIEVARKLIKFLGLKAN